jgi:hypothetical protein
MRQNWLFEIPDAIRRTTIRVMPIYGKKVDRCGSGAAKDFTRELRYPLQPGRTLVPSSSNSTCVPQ